MADSIQSAYDEILEDTACPQCHTVGMLPDGGLEYICPECGYEGSLDESEEDEDEEEN